ncbi:MAG: metalloregulator ArsR/SmtB family transcription factor [Candidatus Nanohaloarchaea archaeon]|nr:metalloregulator ArsR/SmtB family transcription factor [Candidatus Nanohaloarchaea archaeon]
MDARVYARLFQALADETRMQVVEALRDGERSVNEIAAATGLAQNTVSYHLSCLTNCGFAEREVQGNERIYALNDAVVDDLFAAIEDHIDRHRNGILTCDVLEES